MGKKGRERERERERASKEGMKEGGKRGCVLREGIRRILEGLL